MIKVAAIIMVLFSLQSFASENCESIAREYEVESYIYILCNDLTGTSQKEAQSIISSIFSQRKGPPDETLIYFVTSPEFIGKHEFPAEVLSGLYYTHNNELEIWPEIPSKKQIINLGLE
ncbi:MAG: hypothetical protein RPS47_04970 [Colwellia sp.]